MKITVGIPAFNEAKNIAAIITELKKITDSIVVCDDGSSDLTADISEKLGASVIKHKKNMGYGAAINSIFKKCVEINSDILVTFDADGQHRIVDLEKVLQPIKKNKADIVIGSRFLDKKIKIPAYRKLGINIITKVTNSTLNEKLTDAQSGFRAYSKDVLRKIIPTDTGMGVSTELLIKSSSLGFRISEVPINVSYEGETSTHNPVSHGVDVLLSTIKYTALERPLKFYGIPAMVFLVIGFSFTFLSIQFYADVGRLSTNLTLISAGTVLIGVILAVTAILLFSLTSIVKEKK